MAPIVKSIVLVLGVEILRRSPAQVYHEMVAIPDVGDHRSEVTHTSRSPVVMLWKGDMMTSL